MIGTSNRRNFGQTGKKAQHSHLQYLPSRNKRSGFFFHGKSHFHSSTSCRDVSAETNSWPNSGNSEIDDTNICNVPGIIEECIKDQLFEISINQYWNFEHNTLNSINPERNWFHSTLPREGHELILNHQLSWRWGLFTHHLPIIMVFCEKHSTLAATPLETFGPSSPQF